MTEQKVRAGLAGAVRPAVIERRICRTEKAGEGRNLGYDRWKGTGGLPEWGLPVSYTHLDVYKRQADLCAEVWMQTPD